jgi:hypothetical protein
MSKEWSSGGKFAVWVCLLALGAAVPSAQALDVLIADDYFDGDLDFLVAALAGHTVTHVDNTDPNNNPVRTDDVDYMSQFDVVIFYGSGDDDWGRAITAAEQRALEAYIQGGGNLISTGYDTLGDPNDPLLADVVRSSTFGDDVSYAATWTAANVDHFILNGPFGDFRGRDFAPEEGDIDDLSASALRGAVSLGSLDGTPCDKIIFTDVVAPGGSVGMWNGNDYGNDWDPGEADGAEGLAILRNWLAGLGDADGDGVFDAEDDCPGTAAGDPVDADGCSTADDDGDGVLNEQDDCPGTASCATVDADGCPTDADGDGDGVIDGCDECPDTPSCATSIDATGCAIDTNGDFLVDGCTPAVEEGGCCGATGPVAPLALAIGMLLLSRFTGYRSTSRRR